MLVEYYWTVSRTMLDAFIEVYVMVFLVHWDGLGKGNGYNIVWEDDDDREKKFPSDRYSMVILLTKVE